MTTLLGIDHALVCVNDIEKVRDAYVLLGFLNRGFRQHPWGTSTTILIFRDQLFEIVGIGDPTLLDGYETGGFRFGRYVEAHLAEREGVCLTALNSKDAAADAEALAARGVEVTGTIDFGRDVTGPDGTPDRTRTRLAILRNRNHPRLSLFACQQFRRDLIEMLAWMDHPNGVTGIAGLTVVAAPQDMQGVADWLGRVHGQPGRVLHSMTRVATATGAWTVTDRDGFAQLHGAVPPMLTDATLPGVAGIDLRTRHPRMSRRALKPSACAAGGWAARWSCPRPIGLAASACVSVRSRKPRVEPSRALAFPTCRSKPAVSGDTGTVAQKWNQWTPSITASCASSPWWRRKARYAARPSG